MNLRPKVPACTDCSYLFAYAGRNPGKLGNTILQYGESYCTKRKTPRLLGRWRSLLCTPDWCPKRVKPSLVRIYDFLDTESWLMHEKLCQSFGKEIPPEGHRYALSEVRQLDMDVYEVQKQLQHSSVEALFSAEPGLHQVIEVFDGVQSLFLYKTLDGFVPAPAFDAERARQNRKTLQKASA